MFLWVSYRLCKSSLGGNVQDKSKSQQAVERLQNAFVMSILMGLTWVFGFFAIEDAKLVFTLTFCLCNSFQGFFLFLLFCARQEDVRKALRPYMPKLCRKSSTPLSPSQTASTGVLSSTLPPKSPYSDMDFSAAVPMSLLSADNPTDDTTGNAMEQKAVPVAIKEEELPSDTEMTSVATDSDTNIQTASGSETHDALRQGADGEVISSGENYKRLQAEKDEGIPSNEDEIPTEKGNEGLPGAGLKDNDLQKEEDGLLPVQKDNRQEHVEEDPKEDKDGVLQKDENEELNESEDEEKRGLQPRGL